MANIVSATRASHVEPAAIVRPGRQYAAATAAVSYVSKVRAPTASTASATRAWVAAIQTTVRARRLSVSTVNAMRVAGAKIVRAGSSVAQEYATDVVTTKSVRVAAATTENAHRFVTVRRHARPARPIATMVRVLRPISHATSGDRST